MRLATSIAADRQRLGLSQQELARQLGVSQQSVSKWEEGLSMPRSKRAQQLVSFFGKKSETASVLTNKVDGGRSNRNRIVELEMAQASPPRNYAQLQSVALHDLARAAQDIARAAQALADSVQALAARPPAPPPPQQD